MSPQLTAAMYEKSYYTIEITRDWGLLDQNYVATIVARQDPTNLLLQKTEHRFKTAEDVAEWVLVAVDAWL